MPIDGVVLTVQAKVADVALTFAASVTVTLADEKTPADPVTVPLTRPVEEMVSPEGPLTSA